MWWGIFVLRYLIDALQHDGLSLVRPFVNVSKGAVINFSVCCDLLHADRKAEFVDDFHDVGEGPELGCTKPMLLRVRKRPGVLFLKVPIVTHLAGFDGPWKREQVWEKCRPGSSADRLVDFDARVKCRQFKPQHGLALRVLPGYHLASHCILMGIKTVVLTAKNAPEAKNDDKQNLTPWQLVCGSPVVLLCCSPAEALLLRA